MKRITLFLATNLAVVLVLSITVRLLGLEPYLNQQGLNLNALLVFAAVFGFGGAFISLAFSKWTAKRAVGAQVITEPSSPIERWLVQTVARQAEAAGIKLPGVAIYESPEIMLSPPA
jgi:heat shock protein HtpX